MDCNQIVICGNIVRLDVLRYSPAGVAIMEFVIKHVSRRLEAGMPRQVMCEILAVALGQIALTISDIKIGSMVKLTGYLNKKSFASHQLILHVDHIVLI
ncbi:MAG: primosomal replication protein N [Pseudomonadota bacterium]